MPDSLFQESDVPPDDVVPEAPAPDAPMPDASPPVAPVVLSGLAVVLGVAAFALLVRLLLAMRRELYETHAVAEHAGLLTLAGAVVVVLAGVFLLVLTTRRTGRRAIRIAAVAIAVVGLVLVVSTVFTAFFAFYRVPDDVGFFPLAGMLIAYSIAGVSQLNAAVLLSE
ncbi:hypothetical protein Acy02nite_61900 [Actinoplanes cyaneus]|uniref:Uncharacterized protein n=1 Tax=Actinoplanes cyaneus TaxID=52696 RepID=A0A919ILX9_9ACTN|nr:hypothetical protein [Actinoplanes cyaneus]GID68309.1 hypothetical protein Acy02nite_61900 [Actinoplanes cyaneus]